jgi:fructose-specific phosphotransferase system IIC component
MILIDGWQTLLLCGALGAFVKDIFSDDGLQLPSIKDGFCNLGFVGGIIVGALAGYFVDNDPTTAFLGGYAGTQIIQSLVISRESQLKKCDENEKV